MSARVPAIMALVLVAALAGCAGGPPAPEPDVMEVTLPVPAEQVKTALSDVLTQGGYRSTRMTPATSRPECGRRSEALGTDYCAGDSA